MNDNAHKIHRRLPTMQGASIFPESPYKNTYHPLGDDTPRRALPAPTGRYLVKESENYFRYPMKCIETLRQNYFLYEFVHVYYQIFLQSITPSNVFTFLTLSQLVAFIEIFDISKIIEHFKEHKPEGDEQAIIKDIELINYALMNRLAQLVNPNQTCNRQITRSQSKPTPQLLPSDQIDQLFGSLSTFKNRLVSHTRFEPLINHLSPAVLQAQPYLKSLQHWINAHTPSIEGLYMLADLTQENIELINMLVIKYADFLIKEKKEKDIDWTQCPCQFKLAYTTYLLNRYSLDRLRVKVFNTIHTWYFWDHNHLKSTPSEKVNVKLVHPEKRARESSVTEAEFESKRYCPTLEPLSNSL